MENMQIAEHIQMLDPELEEGGQALSAFEGELMVGICVLGNRPLGKDGDMLQLVFLHVSREYRRRGIASHFMRDAAARASARGAQALYISATESESAVGYYLQQGARLAEQVDDRLYALEPEDIHLVLPI